MRRVSTPFCQASGKAKTSMATRLLSQQELDTAGVERDEFIMNCCAVVYSGASPCVTHPAKRTLTHLSHSGRRHRTAPPAVCKGRLISDVAFVQTATALSNFALAMTLYPEVQRRAQAELDAVVGPHRLPNFSDQPSLPYVDAIVKETLRWNPVVPLGEGFHSSVGCANALY